MTPYAPPGLAYTETSVLTAPPERLIVMLYDGALRHLSQCSTAMRDGQRQLARDRMRRVEAIIDELNLALDREQGGELAAGLRDLYHFCKRRLHSANLRSDADAVDSVRRLLQPLREAWQTIAERKGA